MSEDIEVYLDGANEGGSYIESLARSRQWLKDTFLLTHLDEVIYMELELAKMGAEKAKSEILKKNKADVVRPIK